MLRKIWAIAYKDLYLTFTDRTLLLIMLVTPLAISSIIGFAFSGFIGGGNDVSVRDIPLAVVNLDVGANGFSQGSIFVEALVPTGDPDPDNDLYSLTNAVALSDAAAARAAVDDGTYAAAIIIPADFSESLAVTQTKPAITPTTIEVYVSPASPVSANIVSSIAQGFADQISAGSIAVAATIAAFSERASANPVFGITFAAAAANDQFTPDFAPAFTPSAAAISIERLTVTGEQNVFNPLVVFGSAQALFFVMFTALGASASIMDEQRSGTLQRQAASPTPQMTLLLGKMLGTLVTSIVQVTLLILALSVIGSLIAGEVQFIWGDNLLLLLLVVLFTSLSATGVGSLISSLVRTSEQANAIGSVVAILFGLFSGAFFNVEAIPGSDIIRRLTPNYWGVEAFTKLSVGDTDIGLNLVVLLVLGAAFFIASTLIFSRRLQS